MDQTVGGTVEQTFNASLNAKAEGLCQACRNLRTRNRRDTRAGQYKRKLDTQAGPVEIKMPKLRTLPFESAIIERYRRRESWMEEALIKRYPCGHLCAPGGRCHRGAVGYKGR